MNNPLDALKDRFDDKDPTGKVLDTQPRDDANKALDWPENTPPKEEKKEAPQDPVKVVADDLAASPEQEAVLNQAPFPKKLEQVKIPTKEEIQDSYDAMSKLKPGSIAFNKQTRFVANVAGFTGVMVMRREDGTQIVESLKPYTFIRDQQNNIAWTVFKKPKKTLGRFVLTHEKIQRVFNPELAMPTINGYLSCHDAGSFSQIPFTQNRDLVSLFHKLDAQINQTSQTMIMINTEAARKKQKGTFWEKYATGIMLTLCMIMLAIALLELGSDISGFGSQINQLAGILNSLPTGVISKAVGSTPGFMAQVVMQLFV